MSDHNIFSGVEQQEISIRGVPGRSPMFFRDMSMMFAVFTADMGAAADLLPDKRLRPLRFIRGVGVMGINCFEYRHSDIGPYNEVGVSVGLAPGGGLIPGAFSALDSLRSWRFHAHILQLPVTTEIAVHGGLDYFNFPKSLADIRFTQPEGGYRCEVRGSEDGRLAYTFNTRRMRHETPRAPKRMIFNSYPIMDGAVMHAVMEVELHQYASTMLRRPFSFTTGDHPLASLLRRLKPGRLLYFIHAPRCAAVIHAPVAV